MCNIIQNHVILHSCVKSSIFKNLTLLQIQNSMKSRLEKKTREREKGVGSKLSIPPCHLLAISWGDEVRDCKVYSCSKTERRQGHRAIIIILEVQCLKGPYGFSSPAPVKDVQWGIEHPTSNSATRNLNRWARSAEGVLWDKSVIYGWIRVPADSL